MRRAVLRPYGERAAPHSLPERMDTETSYDEFDATLASLASVNWLTFGYRPLIRFLDRAIARGLPEGRPLRLVDAGSGYGDGIRAAAAHLSGRGIPAALTGVDLNPFAAKAAAAVTPAYEGVTVRWVTADVFAYATEAPPPDLVTSALFCHHLESEDVPRFLSFMDRTATRGWLVNDLFRSRFAAVGFGVMASLLRKHPHVRHDGPVSFARSFRRADWERFLDQANIHGARVFIGAPFRLCVEKHV